MNGQPYDNKKAGLNVAAVYVAAMMFATHAGTGNKVKPNQYGW